LRGRILSFRLSIFVANQRTDSEKSVFAGRRYGAGGSLQVDTLSGDAREAIFVKL